jgi:hypothetical protein
VVLTGSLIAIGAIVVLLVRRSVFGHAREIVPSGAVFVVDLSESLSSRTIRLGQRFYGRLDSVEGTTAIHPGLQVEGVCVAARSAVRGRRGGYLRLTLSGVRDREGHRLPLQTATISVWGDGPGQVSVLPGSIAAQSQKDQKLTRRGELHDAGLDPSTQLLFKLIEPLMTTGHERHL